MTAQIDRRLSIAAAWQQELQPEGAQRILRVQAPGEGFVRLEGDWGGNHRGASGENYFDYPAYFGVNLFAERMV
jgi:hypothetical protein